MNLNVIRQKLDSMSKKGGQSGGVDRKKNFWKPSVGKQIIRIVPSAYDKENPFKEMYFHYGIGKRTISSPMNWGEKDPIKEFAQQLYQTQDKENFKLAKKLQPKMRVLVPVIVRGEEHLGVRLWEFGKGIYMEFLSLADDEDIGDFTDILEGRDITVDTVGPDVTGTAYNKSSVRVKPKTTPLAESKTQIKEWLETQPNPLELFKKYEYNEIKAFLQEWLAPDDEDDDNVDVSSTADIKEETPKEESKPNYQLSSNNGKKDKFDSIFSDDEDDDLPF